MRMKIFHADQVNEERFSKARPDVVFIHCLPAHGEREITDAVVDLPGSVVFQLAEIRLHAQNAVMAARIGQR